MKYNKQSVNNYLLYDTPVENIFISEYAKSAPGDYVKLYLLAFMYANIDMPVNNSKLAKALGLSESIVSDGWDYWEEQGIVKKSFTDPVNPKDYEIEFLNLRETVFGSPKNLPSAGKRVSSGLEDADFSKLVKDVESATGRLLEANEPQAIASWLKDYSMDAEAILFAYTYCVRNGKSTRYNYVEKLILSWHDKGLTTLSAIEDYLGDVDKHYDFYRGVFKTLGFRRNPTAAEKEIMDKWMDEMDCSLEDVQTACKKTSGISNPNINYVNSVLVSMKSKNSEKIALERQDTLNSIDELYEKIREDNKNKAELLRQKIYKECPRLKEISEELKSGSLKISKSILRGISGREDLVEARIKQDHLLEERKELLSKMGYKDNALDPIYSCNKCGDTGLLEDGSRCSCFNLRLAELKK